MGYNTFAGQSTERIAALSDGIFAVAMTLVVLEIKVPEAALVHSELDLLRHLGDLAPRLVMYLMSFLTLGIFWTGQQTQLNALTRADRDMAWIHFAFLAVVAMLPFSTTLLADFIMFRTALLIYWLNILLLGIALYVSWAHARRAGLVGPDLDARMSGAIERRIVVAQGLYAAGALLCIVDTRLSIAAIVLVQLNYAIAPKIRFLYRMS